MYLSQMPVTLEPARCQSRLLRHSPLRTGYVRLVASQSVPHGEPCWSSSRTLGSQVWRSTRRQVQYSYVAQGQPLCWARCPCVVIPLGDPTCVFFHGTAPPPMVSPCLPWQNPLPSLLCSYLTPGGLGLPQRLPYVVLPLASPYV